MRLGQSWLGLGGASPSVLAAKAAKNKNKNKTWVPFFRRKTRTQGGTYCKTRVRTELVVDR
jgi:hypothetical protein